MSAKITTLDNGLRVATQFMPEIESAAIGMWTLAGSRNETLPENGISHLLEHMAFKGTPTRDALQIAEEFDEIGGNLNAYTSTEMTVYHAKILHDDMPKAFEIMADILLNSTFDEGELEKEKQVILQEIAMYDDTPDELVQDMFSQAAYANQAIGRPILGSKESVLSFTPQQIRNYLQKNYHPQHMIFAAAGKVEHEEIVELANRYYAQIPVISGRFSEPASFTDDRIVEDRELEQMHLMLGYEGVNYSSSDFYVQQVLSILLGGGMSSRLFQEVREKRGLAYSIYASSYSFADSGMFSIYSGTSPEKSEELLGVVDSELARVCQDVSDNELERAKNQARASLIMGRESNISVAESLARSLLNFGRVIEISEVRSRIEAVSKEDIMRLASNIFAGKRAFAAIGEGAERL